MKKLMFVLSFLCLLALTACGESAHEHSLSDWQSDATNHWKSCSGCSELLEKTGHTFGEWKVVLEATETSVGSKERVCSVCSYKEVAEIEKLAHSHKLSSWLNDSENHWKSCSGCSELIDKSAHTFDEGVEDGIVTTEAGTVKYTCTTCGYEKKAEVTAFTQVGKLASKTWANYEEFSMYVKRDANSVIVRLVSNNNVFTSSNRNSDLELYFVAGDNLATREGNEGVTKIVVKSNKEYSVSNFGNKTVNSSDVKVVVKDGEKTVVDVTISNDLLGITADSIFGLTCGLWSNVDNDWAPMLALNTTNLASVEDLTKYVRCDKDGVCFECIINDYPENIPTPDYNKEELIADYPYGVADPVNVADPNGDDIYLKVSKEADGFLFEMIGFGSFNDNEYVKLVLHTSDSDGNGWALQASDISFLVSKTNAVKKTNITDFWAFKLFADSETNANNTPSYELKAQGYFTLSFKVDFTEIPNYTESCEVSFIMLEFWNGNVYNAAPWNSAMTKYGVGVGDAAAQSSYQVIQEKVISVDKEALLADYKYQFSTNYYANIERGEYSVVLNIISFNHFNSSDFIRFIVDTDGNPATGVWVIDQSDVGLVICKDVCYLETGKSSFWDGEANKFHGTNTTLNTPEYTEYAEYWTLKIEIDYSELGLNVTKDSKLAGLLIQFNPTIQNHGFNFNGYIPQDVALQNNYFQF